MHFPASPRSRGIGLLPETVKHPTGSPWPLGMGLRSGLTVYFEEEFEAFVFLFLQLCPTCPRTRRTSKEPLTPLGVEGRWQWSSLVTIPGTAQPVQSG